VVRSHSGSQIQKGACAPSEENVDLLLGLLLRGLLGGFLHAALHARHIASFGWRDDTSIPRPVKQQVMQQVLRQVSRQRAGAAVAFHEAPDEAYVEAPAEGS